MGNAHDIPYTGPLSWLYAGEAASAFIASLKRDGDDAVVFDMNGSTETIENGLDVLRELVPDHQITASGGPLPVPPDFSDEPLRNHVGNYPSISVNQGIQLTHQAFSQLQVQGKLRATA